MTLSFLVTLSVVIALTYLAGVATAAIAAALGVGGRREDAIASHDALSVSRFTIPVSVIVRFSKDSQRVSPSIASLLGLNYPEFEVIVVADGVPSATIASLANEWELEAKEFFYRRSLDTADVRRIYRSRRDSRLMLIEKAGRGYGDALNCGVNVARYRYVMSITPEILFDPGALLRLMSPALRDPAHIVGASSHVERVSQSATGFAGPMATIRHPAPSIGAVFERMIALRSVMESRLAWRRLRHGLGPQNVVAVWRRDAVLNLHGFSTTAADVELDMMYRLQAADSPNPGRFDRQADVFGRTNPQPLSAALRLAKRRQMAVFQMFWAWMRRGVGSLDPTTMIYFIASELLTPLAQSWVVLATVFGAAVGWFGWDVPGLVLVMLSFGSASVTVAALFLRGARAGAPEEPELRRLLLAGPLEFILYRPAVAWARLVGALALVLGRSEPARDSESTGNP